MFSAGMTANHLRDCLLNLPPVELLGMKLLQDAPHAGFFPADVPRETLKAAVVEIIAYGDRCQTAARRLSTLTPVPLLAVDLWEFAL
ncbi:MAG: hypothetical protein K8I60_14635 [Anaerolineae bacterium]|nr:hypothetical protein [Anaerolineae bacterium]